MDEYTLLLQQSLEEERYLYNEYEVKEVLGYDEYKRC